MFKSFRATVASEEQMPSCLSLFLQYQMSQAVAAQIAMSSLLDSEVIEYRRSLKLKVEI